MINSKLVFDVNDACCKIDSCPHVLIAVKGHILSGFIILQTLNFEIFSLSKPIYNCYSSTTTTYYQTILVHAAAFVHYVSSNENII